MKKFLALVSSILAVIACCFIVACTDETTQPVVITATDSSFEYEDKTLKDYMDYLQDDGQLSFTVIGGMVTTINGKSNTANSYWMLYTNDKENSDESWGTFEYEGEIYASASLGAESLPVKQGNIYIWVYQTF